MKDVTYVPSCSLGGKLSQPGLDYEYWQPNSTTPTMNIRIVTLQLYVNTKCTIVQLLFIDHIPQLIKKIFFDNNFMFVSIDITEYLKVEYGLWFNNKNVVARCSYICYGGTLGLKML